MKKNVFVALILFLQIVMFSCATKPKASEEAKESEILELKNIELNGTNWIKTRFTDKETKKPLANRKFVIYVIFEDESEGEIVARTDENGWLYVRNLPKGECYADILTEEIVYDDEEEYSDEIATETYVISRNAEAVTAFYGEKEVSSFSKINQKDPTQVLAAFFRSFLSGHNEWQKYVAPNVLISDMLGDYKKFYSVPESISITIDNKKFDAQKGYFTIKIAYTYKGESGEGEDEVTMFQDKASGNWFVEELPL